MKALLWGCGFEGPLLGTYDAGWGAGELAAGLSGEGVPHAGVELG